VVVVGEEEEVEMQAWQIHRPQTSPAAPMVRARRCRLNAWKSFICTATLTTLQTLKLSLERFWHQPQTL
jgi:hypothetical protein